MLLNYRESKFWRDFRARHWERRVPTVLRQPFKGFPFSEDLLLRAMKTFAEDLRGGDQRKPCLVSVGDKELAPRRPLKALFAQKSETLAELEGACAKVFPGKNFGLMVTQMQAVDSGLWSALAAFLQDARPWIGSPPRAFFDLFYGNYSTSFTGVHKDTQEIIAFVVRGEKRILAWPFDYFRERVDEITAGDKFFNKRLTVDYRKYRKDALVLDARAGDVFYWPSDYWHVSETQNGKFSAMLSLGLDRPQETHAKLVQDPSRVTAHQLRWKTAFGFELGCPTKETSRTSGKVTVKKNKSSVIVWNKSDRRLIVASNGHSISVPHSVKVVKLLETISEGEAVTVSNAPRAESSTFFETVWTKHCELKTRKRVSRRNPAAGLVDWLLRVNAAEPAQIN